jgi:hypothetical protein
MSTGVALGDGNQASHFKDEAITGNFIGLMDPTLANGDFYGPQNADIKALSAIGWDLIPEPGVAGLFVVGSVIAVIRRRRQGINR